MFISLDIAGPDVPVPRSKLMEIVEKLESTRIKLYKNIEVIERSYYMEVKMPFRYIHMSLK